MIKRLVSLAALIGGAILAMASEAAWAEKRVALIVGNSSYQIVPQLPNPSRDANAVAKMFRDAGFDSVDVQLNVSNLEFKRAIRRFQSTADQADIAVVYYAGHGLELSGTNYLVPIDARLASDRDAEDEAILLERLVSAADGAKRLRLVILDACRDNPFVNTMRRERKGVTRAVVSGLSRVEPTSTDTLIAYAAKAGSTADDGDGLHSPFTAAVLKNLTVPGLDVRLAFGRVRDEVLKITDNRQEPFVYGSLGGGNISLVPAPAGAQDAPMIDVKADFELVQKIGSRRAWEVFLGTHPSGFYADLARAQMEKANQAPPANMTVAALPPQSSPSTRETSSKEALEWDRLKDSTDPAALRRFIRRYPDSPLSITAEQRMDLLEKAAREREEQARAAREAARKAAEEALREANQRKAELAAAKKREEDERRALAAEAAAKARAAAAELAAAKKREEEERRAKAAEAAQLAKAAEAERKAAEAKQKADLAEREKAAREAAALRAASERQAREAEAARKQAELASAREAACKSEQGKLEDLIAKGSEGSGLEDLKSFSKTVGCDRLRPLVVASLGKFNAEAAKRAAAMPNSPELLRSAQSQLIRLGCLTGKVDGTLNAPTKGALSRYLSIGGQPTENVSVTEALVAELTKHSSRVCPIECRAGQTLKGETCVADEKPKAPPAVAARPKDDEDDARSRRKKGGRQADREQRAKPAPRARQQAVARPSIVSGGRSGGASAMIGVGF
ncbi:MAG: caspase family protein [Bradyrhizobium sp.]|uniref:caspase family protein n=1 Tax=Bradyrhizobium sp. TaxID=376 RepID=UPI002719D160|nr:caspase family protein [Bradyrhizobium sp.]MDO9561681.1 caspase family protein [Bradyrhizobium sp.]MDP3690783.1 caspase family protein [Bradyrhizobium sp.]